MTVLDKTKRSCMPAPAFSLRMRKVLLSDKPAILLCSAAQKLKLLPPQPTNFVALTSTRKSTAAFCSECSWARSTSASKSSLWLLSEDALLCQVAAKVGSVSKTPELMYRGSRESNSIVWKASRYARSIGCRPVARAGRPRSARRSVRQFCASEGARLA